MVKLETDNVEVMGSSPMFQASEHRGMECDGLPDWTFEGMLTGISNDDQAALD